ncbi:gephyrin-like molybdotransferase Glp [[Limnothrix rosea] IAM M-220]|uniref:molybdopterin molybdotransferase MoeA n=1 Tax=[Limnothrix rosea] IAM M-220 TaxID=454133 RepID=UPI00095CE126|nr:gephyrin-like molybdotransferase Glp [[Limnothrix rosea] IAM M-220]OKH15185.1 molybdopterin molybdenumtransferase [[Limnothrix rosea] IAM M-220]
MIPVNEAEAIILKAIAPLTETEIVGLGEGHGRILATEVTGKLDIPHWDNSAMDGYAIRAADVPEQPVKLQVIETIPAGEVPTQTLQAGQAARIFTGAMLPEGADTIVMQENAEREGDMVTILENPTRGKFVRSQGDYYRAGEPLLQAGMRLGAADIAVLAACQCPKFPVFRRPTVAIFSTGDELRSPTDTLQPGQIVDSNRYALTAFVESIGAIAKPLPTVPDDPAKLKETMQAALAQADIVLSTGGVSVGEYDFVEKLLEELGAEILMRKVAIRPGKPLTVAKFPDGKVYFGIPGNPVSALVGCWRFVQPAIKKLSGQKDNWQPHFVWATSPETLKGAGTRDAYLWGNLTMTETGYSFTRPSGGHSSANLINLAQTNALAIVPKGVAEIQTGDRLRVMLINS